MSFTQGSLFFITKELLRVLKSKILRFIFLSTTKEPTGNPRGRPPKRVQKRPPGRPKGEAAIMRDYRERMLASPKSRKVLETIFDAALDDDHKNQAAAWKLIMDRIAPISGFDKSAGASGRASIRVEITGVPEVNIGTTEVLEDAEWTPVETLSE